MMPDYQMLYRNEDIFFPTPNIDFNIIPTIWINLNRSLTLKRHYSSGPERRQSSSFVATAPFDFVTLP